MLMLGISAAVAQSNRNPISVYTADAQAFAAGGAAEQLRQAARDQGGVRVSIGLKFVMRQTSLLDDAAEQAQTAALRAVQTGVARRTLGRDSGEDIKLFDFIPFMSLFVSEGQLATLLADPNVVSVQEDIPRPPLDVDSIPLIHADSLWHNHVTGNKITVAVLDTGVDKTHPLLAGKVASGSEACYSTNGKTSVSLCPKKASSSVADGSAANCNVKKLAGCDHGTHVAGIAVAAKTAKDIGVAPDARLIAIQIFSQFTSATDCGGAAPCIRSYGADQVQALNHVSQLVKKKKITISSVNMSVGGGQFSSACDSTNAMLATAIAALNTQGITVVVAAGNDGYSGSISEPACISGAVAVGSTTKTDQLALYSNHASLVKLLAPGSSITSSVPGGGYGVKSGTSMATPAVAGAFALLKQAKTSATPGDILAALTCTGKTITQREGATPTVINPAAPRIDMVNAYNYLLKPPSVARSWAFGSAKDANDWSPFLGTWTVAAGQYQQTPIVTGWVGSSTANCNQSLDVSATMTRIDPGTTVFSNSGLVLKSRLDFVNKVVSGYWLAYNKCPTDSSGKCTNSATDPAGQAVLWRIDSANWGSGSGAGSLLCQVQASVNVSGQNTVHAVINGSSISYFLNNKPVCTVSDATYTAGPVMAAAYIASSGGHAYEVNQLSIKSLDKAAILTASEAPLLDAAALRPKMPPAGMSVAASAPSRALAASPGVGQ